jgi:hypothetical protein
MYRVSSILAKIYTARKRAYLGVRARAFRIYREIAGGEILKIGGFKWTLFNISVLASQYLKVSVFKNLEKCWSKS